MKRKRYIYNPNPIFVKPLNQKKRPAFIRYAMKCAKDIDVARSEINYVIKPKNPRTGNKIVRFRRLNEHRARAMRAIVQAMLYHYNIASELVLASVEQLSDECGLSTVSLAGNKSITRASRLITDFMEPMGFVVCEKIWDNIIKTYIPKMITITPLFFMLFGISKFKLDNARRQHLGWINSCLKEKGEPSITVIEAKRIAKDIHIKNAFKHRKSIYIFNKQRNQAKKLIELDEKSAKQKILQDLVKRYSIGELVDMGVNGLKKQVSMEYFRIKKIAGNIFFR
ncbi:Probable replication-associated protein RepA1 (plasmid) [Buchnera aphidicola (Neophyllaphis podocarpi)]|uniref:plasmid replication initiator RepA n=1 Tax=Buchnera aphidicola TaxID=9 RepID=UPI0034647B12